MAELQELLALEASFAILLIRGTVVYWALYIMFRVAGRRNIGALGFADLVVIMMVAEAVGDSLGGGATTLFDGLVVAATVIGWSSLIDRLCYFVPAVGRLMEPSPICLVDDGRILKRNMRKQFVTRDELMEELRQNGVESLSDVKRVYLESDGEVSVIRRDGGTSPNTSREKAL